ncbi:MAG: hypothetical protein ACQERK_03690 [Campylobacterota bacterium]
MLADIKPIEPMHDFVFYLFVAALILAVAAAAAFAFFLRGLKNPQKQTLKRLRRLDLHDSKKAAYTITKEARKLIVDEQMREKYEQLRTHLEPYKYKKSVPAFDKEVRDEFSLFLELAGARV